MRFGRKSPESVCNECLKTTAVLRRMWKGQLCRALVLELILPA